MPPVEPFGPFREELQPPERTAQLRSLRTLVRVYFRLPELERMLRAAETSDEARRHALKLFDAVPALKRRRILSTFALIHSPAYTSPGKHPNQEATNGTTPSS